MEDKIFCTSCGAENKAGTYFCVNCGKELNPIPKAEPQETETLTGDVVMNDYQGSSTQDGTFSQSSCSAPNEPNKNNNHAGAAIASLVCGILSLLCCPISCCGFCCGSPNVILAIVAVVLGIVALVNAFDGKGMAIAGIICGGVALIGMMFTLALPNTFTKGLVTGVLGEEYNMGDLDEILNEFGAGYDFS